MSADHNAVGPVPALHIADAVVRGEGGRAILTVKELRVAPGEKLGVRGPSGAGKSTLLHLITGLVPPASGSVQWGGADLALLPEHKRDAFRREHFGLIFQDFLLFEELSALANASVLASFAPKAARAGIVRRAAMHLKTLGVPGGARGVDTFSGGERQRVAVARALAGDPPVLIADEPTAALDHDTAQALLKDLMDIATAAGKTMIVVSHDHSALQAMDRVIEVLDGEIKPGAAPREVPS